MEKETVKVEEKVKGKSKFILYIICGVVILAIIAVVCFILINNNPKNVVNKYVEAMKEGNADKLMEITDVKGALAWEKCDKNPEKFNEEYKNISDEDVKSKKESMKQQMEGAIAMLKMLGGMQMDVKSIENTQDLGNGIYKVKANVQMKLGENEQNQALLLAIYNGKYIGEIAE